MDVCFKCGASEENKKLFDAISREGIVKICEDCLAVEKCPIIRKPVEVPVSEPPKSIRERLVGMNKKSFPGNEPKLRDLIDQKYKAKNPQVKSDLVDNFHWTIQRIRRVRKITREQFSKGIDEPEATIRMIEGGFLPEDNYKIISKIEKYLGVSLRKNGSGFPNTEEKKFVLDNSLIEGESEEPRLGFDYNSADKLKVGDLKKMDEGLGEEEKSFFKKFAFWNKKKKETVEEEKDNPLEWSEEHSQ
jgi:ribosome-binding protein aMBF1 (putative translation factor)